MTKVIDLGETLIKRGEQVFMLCTCNAEDGFDIVVVQGKEHPVVMCMVCRSCEKEHYVKYGELYVTK